VFEGHLQVMSVQQSGDGSARLLDERAFGRQATIVKRNFAADGFDNFGVRKPRHIVEINGQQWRFFDVVSDSDAVVVSLKIVGDLREQSSL